MNIRKENKNDFHEVYEVVKKAFETAIETDGDEQNLVNRLRDSEYYIPELSLIAEDEGRIVGHIMLTKTKVGETTQLLLAPLAVLPEYQKKGVGSKLIEAAHHIAKMLDYDFIILIGHPTYYPKFGYLPAKQFGILSPFEIGDEFFMAYPLKNQNIYMNATIEYAEEFHL